MKVPSLSKPGEFWDVEMADAELARCTCPRYTTSKAPKDCSHVQIFWSALHLIRRCESAGHIPQAHKQFACVCFQCLINQVALMTRKVRQQYVPKDVAKAKVAAARAKKRKPRVRESAANVKMGKALRRWVDGK